MYDNHSKGISYMAGFFLLIAFVIAGISIVSTLSGPIWTGMTGLPASEMEKGTANPARSAAWKVLQAITGILGFLIPAIAGAFVLNRKPLRLLGFSGPIRVNQMVVIILIMFFALLVSNGLSHLTHAIPLPTAQEAEAIRMEKGYNEKVAAIMGLNNMREYLLALVIMGFLPALCEEALFRGGLQNFMTRSTQKPWLSILVVSAIFSAVHFSYYGFLSRFFLAVILGLIYQYSGRLWLSILAHFLNNAAAITALYILKKSGPLDIESMDDTINPYWGLAALPVLAGLLLLFKRVSFNTARPG